MSTTTGLIDPIFLATPQSTVSTGYGLFASGAILPDIGFTLFRVSLGFLVGAVIGVPVGFALGYFKTIYDAVEIIVEYCRSLPATSLFPLFIIFFGIGDTAKIAVAAFITVWIVIVNTAAGVANASKTRQRWFQTLRPSQFEQFRHVLVYEAAPMMMNGLRTCLGLSMVVVIATEMFIGTVHGLGARIYDAQLGAGSKVPEMYASIIVAGFLGFALNRMFLFIQTRWIHWAGR